MKRTDRGNNGEWKVRVHVGGACVHARCEIGQGKAKVEEAQLQRLLISKCYRECAAARTFFFKLFKGFHMQHLEIKAI